MLLCGTSPWSAKNGVLEFSSTARYRGVCIFYVVIHHIVLLMQNPNWLYPLRYTGHYCVCFFFFLSGYGLESSLQQKEGYLNHFLSKRIMKIYFPFLCVNAIASFLPWYHQSTAWGNLRQVVGISLLDQSQWFIIAILYLYAAFWLAHKVFRVKIALIVIFLLTALWIIVLRHLKTNDSWWYMSVAFFPLGCYFASKKARWTECLSRYGIRIFSLSLVALFVGAWIEGEHCFRFFSYFSPIPFVVAFVSFSLVRVVDVNGAGMRGWIGWVGGISLEIYMTHMKWMPILTSKTSIPYELAVLLYLFCTISSAYLLHLILQANSWRTLLAKVRS